MKIEITGVPGDDNDLVRLLAEAIGRSSYSLRDGRLEEKVTETINEMIRTRISALIDQRLDEMVTKALGNLTAEDLIHFRLKAMLRKLIEG